MRRKIAHLSVVPLILAALAPVAWAAAKGPAPKSYYASAHPRLSVYVDQPATTVELYVACFTSTNVSEYWDSAKLPFKHDEFSFDGKTTIGSENGATFTQSKGTVLFNGKFSHGKFTGEAQIVGSSCPKSRYTAKFDKNGGGSGR